MNKTIFRSIGSKGLLLGLVSSLILSNCTKERNPNDLGSFDDNMSLKQNEMLLVTEVVNLSKNFKRHDFDSKIKVMNSDSINPYDWVGVKHNETLEYFNSSYNFDPEGINVGDLNNDGVNETLHTNELKIIGTIAPFIRSESEVPIVVTPVNAAYGMVTPSLNFDYQGAFKAFELHHGKQLPLFDKTFLGIYLETVSNLSPSDIIEYSKAVKALVKNTDIVIPTKSKNSIQAFIALFKHSKSYWVNEYLTKGSNSNFPHIRDIANDPNSDDLTPAQIPKWVKKLIGVVLGDAMGVWEVLGPNAGLIFGLGQGWSLVVIGASMSLFGGVFGGQL